MASDKLLGLLRKQEWIRCELYDAAQAANVAAHAAGMATPHTQVEMVQLELNMLRAQIELEREESTSVPNVKRGG